MKLTARNATLLLIIGTIIFRLWGAAMIGWGTGESYYLSSARVLHLSYFDQPPFSLWLIWATKTLFNSESEWVIRLPFVLMFGWTSWLVYRLGEQLQSPRAGFFATLILNSSLLFVISIGSWIQPDAPMLLLWMLIVHALADVFFGDGPKKPYLVWAKIGVLLGLTFLAKYHAVFLVSGAGLFALTHGPSRRWILHPAPYLALTIAALITIPVWMWNAQNQWVSFAFQGGRAIGATGLHWDWLLRMMLGQLLYNSPWIALPALIAGGRALLKGPAGAFPADARMSMSWFLVMIAAPPILLFTIVALWSDTQFHFHWQAPGYILLFPILGAWADAGYQRFAKSISAWLAIAFVLTNVLIAILIVHASSGWLRTVFPDMGDDPTKDVLNWTEVGDYLQDSGILADENNFVAGLGWINCGKIDPQVRGQLPLACFSADPRNLAFNVDLGALAGRTSYFVVQSTKPLERLGSLPGFFSNIERVKAFEILRNGRAEISDIWLVRAENFAPVRTYESGAQAIEVTQLPHMAISRLTGSIANDGDSGLVRIMLDGEVIGEVNVSADGATSFDMEIADAQWHLPMRNVRVALEMPNGELDKLSLQKLTVTQE